MMDSGSALLRSLSGMTQRWFDQFARARDYPLLALNAVSVLRSRQAIVIGPTPPGTGVIAPAVSRASAKATSPVSLPSGRRLMPTSMTVAPGLIHSPLTKLGAPHRGDDDVGAAHDGGEIPGARMSDGHRAVGLKQQLRDGAADEL